MKSNYDIVMDHVFVSEGGYAERDSEPGGAVNMGISFTRVPGLVEEGRRRGRADVARPQEHDTRDRRKLSTGTGSSIPCTSASCRPASTTPWWTSP